MTDQPRLEAMRIVTGCATIDEFVSVFERFCDSTMCFIPTAELRPVGSELAFSLRLVDGTPVICGTCVVKQAWSTPDNPYRRPGVQVMIRRLTEDSELAFEQLVTQKTVVSPQDDFATDWLTVIEPAPAPEWADEQLTTLRPWSGARTLMKTSPAFTPARTQPTTSPPPARTQPTTAPPPSRALPELPVPPAVRATTAPMVARPLPAAPRTAPKAMPPPIPSIAKRPSALPAAQATAARPQTSTGSPPPATAGTQAAAPRQASPTRPPQTIEHTTPAVVARPQTSTGTRPPTTATTQATPPRQASGTTRPPQTIAHAAPAAAQRPPQPTAPTTQPPTPQTTAGWPAVSAGTRPPATQPIAPPRAVAPAGTQPPVTQATSPKRVLPANPLSDFTDDTLSAFVDAAVAEVHDPLVAIAAHVERSAQTRIGAAPTTTRRPAHAPRAVPHTSK